MKINAVAQRPRIDSLLRRESFVFDERTGCRRLLVVSYFLWGRRPPSWLGSGWVSLLYLRIFFFFHPHLKEEKVSGVFILREKEKIVATFSSQLSLGLCVCRSEGDTLIETCKDKRERERESWSGNEKPWGDGFYYEPQDVSIQIRREELLSFK